MQSVRDGCYDSVRVTVQEKMNRARAVDCPLSICLAMAGLLLLIALWIVPFPGWLEGAFSGIVVGVCYFAICPALMFLAIGFSVRDLFQNRYRVQACIAICISAAVLWWYWLRPPL